MMRYPTQGEVVGTLTECGGCGRFKAECADGKCRSVRIAGKIKDRVKVKAGFTVLLRKWSIEPDEKADIVWVYRPAEIEELRRRGLI